MNESLPLSGALALAPVDTARTLTDSTLAAASASDSERFDGGEDASTDI